MALSGVTAGSEKIYSRTRNLALVAACVFQLFGPGSKAVGAQAVRQNPYPSTLKPSFVPPIWQPGRDTALQALIVTDDFGNPISEELIRSRMRQSGGGAWRTLMGVLGGAAGGAAAGVALGQPKNDADCSIHEPCTDREKFYKSSAPLVGAFVGALAVYGAIGRGVSRVEAVALIRAERRRRRGLAVHVYPTGAPENSAKEGLGR